MFDIISLKVAKFHQALLITLGVADEKPEGGGQIDRKIGLSSRLSYIQFYWGSRFPS